MCDMPQIWDEHDGLEYKKKHFTIGRGKKEYVLWSCGAYGIFYCFQVDVDGYACNKRAVEPTKTVFLHIQDEL